MGGIAGVIGAVGAVTSVVGGIMKGDAAAQQAQAQAAAQEEMAQAQNEAQQAAAQQATYQAQVADNNASIAKQNQTTAERAAAAQAQAQSMQSAQTIGATRAAAAAGGLDPNSGTPLNVEQGERKTGQMNTLNTWNNAMQVAYGYQQTAVNDQASAGLYRQGAQQDIIAGKYDLAGGQLALNAGNAAASNDIMSGIFNAAGTGLSDSSNIGFKWAGLGGTNDIADSPDLFDTTF